MTKGRTSASATKGLRRAPLYNLICQCTIRRLKPALLVIILLLSFTSNAQVAERLRSVKDADTTLVYQSNGAEGLVLYGFYPEDRSSLPRPVMVFFHGGGWKKGSPASMAPHCRYFASRGFITFTAAYGFAEENGTRSVADCVVDAKAAVRFLYNHADDLGIDKENFILSGGSAGGHLALAVAMDLGTQSNDGYLSGISALILFNPATVLTQQERLPDLFNVKMQKRENALYGGNPVAICPLSNVGEGLAPTLLMYGSKDWVLPAARLFQEASQTKGNRCEVRVWEGLEHGFYHIGKNESRNFIETCEEADQFLQSLGLVSGAPQVETFVRQFQKQD